VRPSQGWQAWGWLLVSLSLVSMGLFPGCEKAGGGGQQAEEPPPSSAPPSTTPTPTAPATGPVVGINLTAEQTSLPIVGSP
jgi:hypothetical protein